jgi:predicted transcriptional regulator
LHLSHLSISKKKYINITQLFFEANRKIEKRQKLGKSLVGLSFRAVAF